MKIYRLKSFTLAGVFENVVELMYKSVVPKPKEECSRTEQLGVAFAAGYVAGIACVFSLAASAFIRPLTFW